MHPFGHISLACICRRHRCKCHVFQMDAERGEKTGSLSLSACLKSAAMATAFEAESMTRFDISWIVLCFRFVFEFVFCANAISSGGVSPAQLWLCYCYCGIALCNRPTVLFFASICTASASEALPTVAWTARLAFVINKIIWSILIDSTICSIASKSIIYFSFVFIWIKINWLHFKIFYLFIDCLACFIILLFVVCCLVSWLAGWLAGFQIEFVFVFQLFFLSFIPCNSIVLTHAPLLLVRIFDYQLVGLRCSLYGQCIMYDAHVAAQ